MSDDKKPTATEKAKELVAEKKAYKGMVKVKSGFVVVEFTENHASRKKGDKETYHHTTADALVSKKKLGVAKVIEELEKYVPKKSQVV